MEESIRAFVAVEIPGPLRALCAEICRRLAPATGRVGWVKPENLHLTLKFLGNADPSRLERLAESLAHKGAKLHPFEVELKGLGCFPSPRRPRVIWVGTGEGAEALALLAQKVEGAAAKAGFSREARAFSPHLTLGRVRMDSPPADLGSLLAREDPGSLGRFFVTEVILMKSRLDPGGSIYTPLRRIPLGRREVKGPPA
ncbi:MAG: 2'-5' RNA ligase [Deltaproteobacteria bacterium RBG_13_65_10]|nr:MAG: 2'-5' RNA ligase [Deltaproteobacteria bacterium RBG_13_65_10]